MVFWVLAGLMLALAMFIVLRPLRSKAQLRLESNHQRNIAIARERRNEINSAFDTGDITKSEKQLAMADLETALADELNTSAELSNQHQHAPKFASSITLLAIPVIALLTYTLTGAVNYQTLAQQSAPSQQAVIPSLDDLVGGLEARLKTNANDERGLFLLAQTYSRIGRYADAQRTYNSLLGLTGPNADLLAEQADVMVMDDNRVFTARSLRILKQALSLDPHHIKARWLMGLGQLEFGQTQLALENWLWAVLLLRDDSDTRKQIQSLIDSAKLNLGSSADTIELNLIAKIQAHNESAEHLNLNQASVASSKVQADTSAQGVELKVVLSLDPSLQSTVQASDTVFIVAKAQSGPKVPLAVVRKTVADLPLQVTLNDSNAMIAQMSISRFSDLVVSARISRSGEPIAQSGDIKTPDFATKNSRSQPIKLILSERIK